MCRRLKKQTQVTLAAVIRNPIDLSLLCVARPITELFAFVKFIADTLIIHYTLFISLY